MRFEMEYWPIDRFREYENNPRLHDVDMVNATADAIREFGFRVPVVAKSDGLVVDGHLRLKAARALGLKEVPVLLADDLTDVQIRAFRLSVNKVADLAKWNFELLAEEIQSLDLDGFDTSVIGFSDSEIEALLEGDFGDLSAFGDANKSSDGGARDNSANYLEDSNDDNDTPPDGFKDYSNGVETEYRCPYCNYEWSGKPK